MAERLKAQEKRITERGSNSGYLMSLVWHKIKSIEPPELKELYC